MLRVTIDLIPHGREDEKKTLRTIEIINDGTSRHRSVGNYSITSGETEATISGYSRANGFLLLISKSIFEIYMKDRNAKNKAGKCAYIVQRARKSDDRLYGARPVRRLIEKSVEGPIADMIIDGRLDENSAVEIDADEFGIKIDLRRS